MGENPYTCDCCDICEIVSTSVRSVCTLMYLWYNLKKGLFVIAGTWTKTHTHVTFVK